MTFLAGCLRIAGLCWRKLPLDTSAAVLIPCGVDFLTEIQGGIGEDVWDREIEISAADFRDAANQAIAHAEELGGQVVMLQQFDKLWQKPISS